MKILSIHAREILDSRGNPTIETEITLEGGFIGRASVPSGASTGSHEALELRDNDPKRFGGNGVLSAVNNVNTEIASHLMGKEIESQLMLDTALIALDGTENKARLGANAILSVSMAALHAFARAENKPLFEYVRTLSEVKRDIILPLPLCNVVNGGKHAAGSTDIQEFMIAPIGFPSFREALRASSEVFHSLKAVLESHGYGTTVGDEGGYAPHVKRGNAEVLELISEAIEKTGYALGTHFVFALDVAASSFFSSGKYELKTEGREMNEAEMIAWNTDLVAHYPIASIEDGLAEDSWSGWTRLTEALGEKIQLVGDDLLVTNVKFLKRAIDERAANAILIKMNQIGTVTETIQAVDMAHKAGWRAIISHRSGETDDTTISHLAVGLGTGQIKTGSLSRGERVAKYNELLRIEEMLGADAKYAGNAF